MVGSLRACAVTSTGGAANGTHDSIFLRILGERGVRPLLFSRVRHQDAGATGHRHDREAARRRQPAAGAGVGDLDQILGSSRTLDAELAQGSIVNGVAAGQRGGVRGRRRSADRRAADLHCDDRLAVLAGARHGIGKQRAVLDRLDIAGDRLGVGVVGHERDPVGDRDLGLVAGAHPHPDLDAAARRQGQQTRLFEHGVLRGFSFAFGAPVRKGSSGESRALGARRRRGSWFVRCKGVCVGVSAGWQDDIAMPA